MEMSNLSLIVILVAVLVLGVQIYLRRERPASMGEWAELAQEAERVAWIGVKGAQQLYESGQIEGDDRFEYADQFLAEMFPALAAGHRQSIIEGAVFALKQLRRSGVLPASDAPAEAQDDLVLGADGRRFQVNVRADE